MRIEELSIGDWVCAEWEYKRFLHKACEWLKDEISNYVFFDGEIDEDLITDFIKEMEE